MLLTYAYYLIPIKSNYLYICMKYDFLSVKHISDVSELLQVTIQKFFLHLNISEDFPI